MTDPSDAAPPAASPVARKGRSPIFGPRKALPLRLDLALHDQVMARCIELGKPANAYITDLIKEDLKKRQKSATRGSS